MANRKFRSTNPLGSNTRGGKRSPVGLRRGYINERGYIVDVGPAGPGSTRRFGLSNKARPPGGNIVCGEWAYGVPPHDPYPPQPLY